MSRSHARLRAPWGFGVDEQPRRARWLFVDAPSRSTTKLRDEDLIARGGSRSALGRTLRATELWDGNSAVRNLKAKEFDALVSALLGAAKELGLVSEEVTPFDQMGWRLVDACIVFKKATPAPGEDRAIRSSNTFFRDLYASLAGLLSLPGHPLFGFEAREHTAQVEAEKRQIERNGSVLVKRSARNWRGTSRTFVSLARPTGFCRCCSAPQLWNWASISRRSTRSTSATSRPHQQTTPNAAAGLDAVARRRWCSRTARRRARTTSISFGIRRRWCTERFVRHSLI